MLHQVKQFVCKVFGTVLLNEQVGVVSARLVCIVHVEQETGIEGFTQRERIHSWQLIRLSDWVHRL